MLRAMVPRQRLRRVLGQKVDRRNGGQDLQFGDEDPDGLRADGAGRALRRLEQAPRGSIMATLVITVTIHTRFANSEPAVHAQNPIQPWDRFADETTVD